MTFDPKTLPGRVTDGGYIYALRFANGVTKIGCSDNPKRRIGMQASTAAGFGVPVIECRLLFVLGDFRQWETLLLSLVKRKYPRAGGREYFRGITPNEAIAQLAGILTRQRECVERPEAEFISPPPTDGLKLTSRRGARRRRRSAAEVAELVEAKAALKLMGPSVPTEPAEIAEIEAALAAMRRNARRRTRGKPAA